MQTENTNRMSGREKHAGKRTTHNGIALLLLGSLITLGAACQRGQQAALQQRIAARQPLTVHMNGTAFLQSSITITKGESITLIDDSPLAHVIENGTWNGEIQRPHLESGAPRVEDYIAGKGRRQEIGPFNTAGTFHLYCSVHPGMELTVIVR